MQVKPGSTKGPLVELDDEKYIVYLRERAVEGSANTALIKVLAEYFRLPKSRIAIKRGHRSRIKLIEIPD